MDGGRPFKPRYRAGNLVLEQRHAVPEEWAVYSYAQPIGRIVRYDDERHTALVLVADQQFSMTTNGHIGSLRRAAAGTMSLTVSVDDVMHPFAKETWDMYAEYCTEAWFAVFNTRKMLRNRAYCLVQFAGALQDLAVLHNVARRVGDDPRAQLAAIPTAEQMLAYAEAAVNHTPLEGFKGADTLPALLAQFAMDDRTEAISWQPLMEDAVKKMREVLTC